ncbi:MAG: hypothetical protein ACP5D2_04885, partial [Candidatus Nanoarchaeia archaeon]
MKKQKLKNNSKIERIFPYKEGEHYFFGYYDKSPWSRDEKFILGMRTKFIHKHPSPQDRADILIKNRKTSNVEKIAETNAWCWQQGSMLQWLGPDFNSKIIFNDFDKKKNKLISRIINVRTKKEKIIDFPVYAVFPDGKKALSLNFLRLNDVRKGYGYHNKKDKNQKKRCPEDDGIYVVDLEKNKSQLIISLTDLKANEYTDSMEQGKHWVDHIGISPDGKRACFFHRWYINKELYHTRLFSVDIDGKNLFMFPDSGFYSHIFWKNNKELFGFCSLSEKFGNLRKNKKKLKFIFKKILPFYRKLVPKSIRKRAIPVNYYILNDKTKESIKLNKITNEDGHGTWFNDRYLITDTYPNKKHYRSLILYDLEKNRKKVLGKFYTLPKKRYIKKANQNDYDISSLRCDLHPRWDRKGEKICFDS